MRLDYLLRRLILFVVVVWVAATVNFDHFIRGYNLNLPQLNPAGIIPIGPELDFWEPHGRESRGGPR